MDLALAIQAQLTEDASIQRSSDEWKVSGENPWNVCMEAEWRNVGSIVVRPAGRGDLDALKTFLQGLSANSLFLFAPYPMDEKLDAALEGALDAAEKHENVMYHVWMGDRIIGHCFLWRFAHEEPELGIAIADEFHGKKLGHLCMRILIGVAQASGKKGIELTTNPQNGAGFHLYQAVGFQYVGDIEITIADGSHRIEHKLIYTFPEA